MKISSSNIKSLPNNILSLWRTSPSRPSCFRECLWKQIHICRWNTAKSQPSFLAYNKAFVNVTFQQTCVRSRNSLRDVYGIYFRLRQNYIYDLDCKSECVIYFVICNTKWKRSISLVCCSFFYYQCFTPYLSIYLV